MDLIGYLVTLLFYTVAAGIDSGKFISIGKHEYFISHPIKKNWFEAARYCTFNCLVLVDINDEEENRRILSIITGSEYVKDPSPQYWTSGTDLGSEGHFYWATSAKEVFFSDYADNQPDNAGNENCLEIRGDFGWKWNDHQCEVEKYFICRNVVPDSIPDRRKPVRVANASMGYTYV